MLDGQSSCYSFVNIQKQPGDGIGGYSWTVHFVRTLSTLAPAHRERVRSTPRRTCELPTSGGLSHPTLQTPLQHRRVFLTASRGASHIDSCGSTLDHCFSPVSWRLVFRYVCTSGLCGLPRTGKMLPLKWVVSSGIQSNSTMSCLGNFLHQDEH